MAHARIQRRRITSRPPRPSGSPLHDIEFQFAEGRDGLPPEKDMLVWIELAQENAQAVELIVRFVGEQEMSALNHQFRQKQGPTNVLSFPADVELPEGKVLLGDVVVCSNLLHAEANAQGKSVAAHTAHLLIHGVLHLRGFDHEVEHSAHAMETLEAELLKKAGFDDPYRVAIQTALQGDDLNPDQGSEDD